jgi:hypothetical protein
MKYTDSITKNFLTYGQPRVSTAQSGYALEWQDPTFLGFQWRIINTQDFSKSSGELDLDYFPQGLFLPDTDTDSAVSYFVRTNQLARADMIRQFKLGFLQILKEAPWYFTKVSGLSDIWKINPSNSFRGKDKKLTFETEESIDLKITYLMDLYRKAVFDTGWMRYALPENQRMFAMELVVAELRPMHTSLSNWTNVNNDNTYTGVILSDINGVFANAASPSAVVSDTQKSLKAPWSTTTFLSFRFDMCTFDIIETSPNYLESVAKIVESRALNKIIINTPYISEVNSYGLLGAVLKESYYNADYSYDIKDLNTQSRTINETLGGKNFSATQPSAANTVSRESVFPPKPAVSPVEQKKPERTLRGLDPEDILINIARKIITAAGLENVYGFSASTTINALQGLQNNPLATFQNVLQQFTAENGINPNSLGNVGLTGEEVELLTNFLGNTLQDPGGSNLIVNNIGNTVEDLQLNNPNLISNDLGKTVEDNINSNSSLVSSNLPKNILTGPDIVKARLGNIYNPQ